MNDKTEIKTVRLVQGIGSKIDWSTKKNKQLIASILSIKNTNEAEKFLRDLMTPIEVAEFANRLEAASLLSANMQYNFITKKTGLSSTTIARIAKWLNGPLGGYRLVLSRFHHTNSSPLGRGLRLSS